MKVTAAAAPSAVLPDPPEMPMQSNQALAVDLVSMPVRLSQGVGSKSM